MRSRYLIALSTLVLFIVVGGCGPSGEQCSTTGTCGDCLDSDDCGTDDCTSCLDLVGDATNCGVAGRICTDAATGIVDGRCENGGCACDAPSDCQGEGLNVDSCALGDGDALRCLCAGYTVNGVEAPCPLGLACVEGGCLFDGDVYATSDALNAAIDGPCVPRSTYRDEDGDGFGNPDVVTPACTAAAGWVDNALDCSDVDSARYPGAPLRPATDSNCDGFIDNDVDGDGVSDVSTDVDFDPMVQRHVELAEVAATVPFAVEVHAGEVDPRGVEVLSTSGFSRVLVWDASRRTLSGTVRDAGAYTVPLSVCRVFPFDEAQCALATNRRVDLAHLTVQAAQPPEQAPTVAATGPYRAAFRDVVLDVSGILRDLDVRFLPRLAEGLTDPTRQQELLGLATASPMRVIYPALPDSDDVAAGQFPLVVVLHGNGYHWNDYDDLGAQLASHGAVVVVPQFVTGLLGACASTQLRAMFGRRAMQWALAESNTSGLPLTGHLDSTRVVVVGHSWGGAAAEWSMPVWGARAFVILDPISLLHNVLEWENCNTDLVTLSTTRNHLRPAWRDIAQPVLLLDSGRSGFVATQAEFRGLYPHGPTVHVSTQDTQHEDFLDPEEGVLWFEPNTCFDPILGQAHRRLAAMWMVRFIERHVNGNLAFDSVVHGKAALDTAPQDYPRQVFTSTYQPSMRALLLDQATTAQIDSSWEQPRPNLAGGTSVATGTRPRVGLAPAAQDMARPDADGTYNVFSQATLDFLRSDQQSTFRHLVIDQETAPVRWSQTFEQPLDASDYHVLAWEMSATGLPASTCTLDAPGDPVDPLDATVTITSQDGRTVQRSGAELQPANGLYRGVPITLMLDLEAVDAQVDLTRITELHVELPPADHARVVAFDSLRLLP